MLKPISRPIIEHLPSFPKRLKLPLVVIPTSAVFDCAKFFKLLILSVKLANFEPTSLSRPNIDAIVFAFLDTLSTSPISVSVERYTTGAISLNLS